MTTTIACLWVDGHLKYYTAAYVARLAAMVRTHMDRAYRFVCLTDRPKHVPKGVEAIRVPPVGSIPAWWWKLRVFDASLGLTGRVLYIDLDSIVVGTLGPILDFPAPLAFLPHEGTFIPKHNSHKVIHKFNGSVMLHDAGTQPDLWTNYRPALTREYWSDQDMLALWRPDAATLPIEWFPRLS